MRKPIAIAASVSLVISLLSMEAAAQSCSGERIANFVAVQRGTRLLLVATGQHPSAGFTRSWRKISGSRYEFRIKAPGPDTVVATVITPYRSRVRFTAPANLGSVTIVEGGQSYTIPVTQL